MDGVVHKEALYQVNNHYKNNLQGANTLNELQSDSPSEALLTNMSNISIKQIPNSNNSSTSTSLKYFVT